MKAIANSLVTHPVGDDFIKSICIKPENTSICNFQNPQTHYLQITENSSEGRTKYDILSI